MPCDQELAQPRKTAPQSAQQPLVNSPAHGKRRSISLKLRRLYSALHRDWKFRLVHRARANTTETKTSETGLPRRA
ncbi:hypothetical protein Plim_3020 [Planctopirus limnophila DSM 3776]|uniref:Uncharacterized protein n=1 Tax=Planctopirus limnophila (strain ATCC 43296 / DSM 3776 / IFAM 1008 / Mu 290) TaxID=521674 RepID=D5SSP1_PLAL2|nr:hypothetical protein Plim_3020 [Planctopirus limnophila DSM 3776]